MMLVLQNVLADLMAMSRTARNPATKKLLEKRMREIREALIIANP
jgi:hypothetical protein